MGIYETFKLFQNNDPKHKVWIVQESFLCNCTHVLHVPDLKSYETCIGGIRLQN